MAAFRLRAASGMLTVESFGLDGVFAPLEEMQPIQPRFRSWIPLEVEWPEAEQTGALDVINQPDVEVVLPDAIVPADTETISPGTADVAAVSLPVSAGR